jgi:hypothetical protein
MRSQKYVLSSWQKYYIINAFLVSFFSVASAAIVGFYSGHVPVHCKDVLGAALVLSRKPYATIMKDIFDRVLQANVL